MDRRGFIHSALALAGGLLLPNRVIWAETFLTLEQAQRVLWGDVPLEPLTVELTREQRKAIAKASKVRVRSTTLKTWRTTDGGWFILDQVIGKHENIDLAVALTNAGKVKGLEVMTYRETYGHEIRNAKWRAQFHGRGPEERLKLDEQIRNISGATLSCAHVTDGINRLTQTWLLVLQHL
ncbi:MAG: FMN-binding protein [Acidobacteriota bacterium]